MNDIVRLRERLLVAPQDTGTMLTLSGLLESSGDLPGAIDLCQRALRVDPYRIDTLLRLGRLWVELGDSVRARSWFERAVSLDRNAVEAARALAELTGEDVLTPAYVRTLFDQYAERFDADLVEVLDYRAPQSVAASLAGWRNPSPESEILDLGCGTGLSGLALRPWAFRLDGVDISPGMVARAGARGIYDSLTTGDVLAFLNAAERFWHVIAAVDMLNYVRDLAPIFAAVAGRLRSGGLWVGTVEKGETGGATLTAKRRYVHSVDHLTDAVVTSGLALLDLAETDLRKEGGVPVAGLVFVARRD